jgi:hypothetical protein
MSAQDFWGAQAASRAVDDALVVVNFSQFVGFSPLAVRASFR